MDKEIYYALKIKSKFIFINVSTTPEMLEIKTQQSKGINETREAYMSDLEKVKITIEGIDE
jgi:hypothetical protein